MGESPKPGPVLVVCPFCREAFTVPTEVLNVDARTNLVDVRLDRTELYGHVRACAARPAPKPAAVERPAPPHPALVGRIRQFLDLRSYVSVAGSRACTMCGTNGKVCLEALSQDGPQRPCCAACGVGNTHPAPQEGMSCAEWAAEHCGPNGAQQ